MIGSDAFFTSSEAVQSTSGTWDGQHRPVFTGVPAEARLKAAPQKE